MNVAATRDRDPAAVLVLALTGLVGLAFLHTPGTGDVAAWLRWLEAVERHGVSAGYALSYPINPPLTFVFLLPVAALKQWLGITPLLAIKASLFLFWCLSAAVFHAWTRDRWLTVGLQLAILLNSVALGYLDVWYTPTLLLALRALQLQRHAWFVVLFAISSLIKWQPLILAPVFALYLARHYGLGGRGGIRWGAALREIAAPAVATLVVLLAGFGLDWLRTFRRTLNDPYLSGNALNLNWVATHALEKWLPGQFGSLLNGYATLIPTTDPLLLGPPTVVFFLVYAGLLLAFWRRENSFGNALRFALAGYLAYFMLKSGVHENHIYPAVVVAAALAAVARAEIGAFVTWSLVANVNLVLFYGLDGSGLAWNRVVWVDLALPIAILNVGLFFVQFRRCVQVPPAPRAAA
jgi:hypothetical protein